MRISVSARAKINLALNITGVREDGYHLIETVMQSVSLSDLVTVSDTGEPDEITVSVSGADVPEGEDNIASRAAAAFFLETGLQNPGIDIRIRKKIPVSAGLGGGSADAAAVMFALNELLDARLETDALCRIGESVGADVPFCITGGTMLAEGVGSILTPLPALPECWIVVAMPAEKPSTAEMYARYDRSPAAGAADIRSLTDAVCLGDLKAAGLHLGNAFLELWEDASLRSALAEMSEGGALGASLSGSGPSVFGIFAEKADAAACAASLRRLCEEVHLCRPESAGCELQ